jgi:2-dehydro-3-deoxygluconokinase
MSIVTFGPTALRLSTRDGQRFETANELELAVDGMASNAAAVASRLGADAVWLSKLPDSPLGRRVVAELGEHGLETDVVWTDDGRQGLLFSEDAPSPREPRSLEDLNNAAVGSLTPGETPVGRIQDADAVLTTGSMAALSEQAAETAGALLRSAPGLRALDLDYYPGMWTERDALEVLSDLFEAVDLLIANEDQAKTVFDRTGSPRELGHTLAADYDFSHVVLTRTQRGVVGYHDGVVHEQSAFETDAIDSAGQHATFVGALLKELVAGATTDKALTHGAAAAALARTMAGPLTPIEPDEVDRLAASDADRL